MSEKRIVMTQEKYNAMLAELGALRQRGAHAFRLEPSLVGHGFSPARDDFEAEAAGLTDVQERINELEEKIRYADVVSPLHRESVYFGSTVKVRDLERNREIQFRLVGPEELDAESGKISSASPIGKALLGHKVGDVVSVSIPKGVLNLKILGFD